jgi:hypothetical protein
VIIWCLRRRPRHCCPLNNRHVEDNKHSNDRVER